MSPAPELKATLTLPQIAFPMKANLPHNEPLRLARWKSLGRHEESGNLKNRLKDFVGKSKSSAGFDAPDVLGFDCHSLPIEIEVDEKLGRKRLKMPSPAVLDACRCQSAPPEMGIEPPQAEPRESAK